MHASSLKIKDISEHVYRTAPSDAVAGKLLGKYVLSLNSKTIAAISNQTDYTQGLLAAVNHTVEQSGVKVINEDYLPGTTGFRSVLLKLKQKAPEVLLINPQLENTFLLILT